MVQLLLLLPGAFWYLVNLRLSHRLLRSQHTVSDHWTSVKTVVCPNNCSHHPGEDSLYLMCIIWRNSYGTVGLEVKLSLSPLWGLRDCSLKNGAGGASRASRWWRGTDHVSVGTGVPGETVLERGHDGNSCLSHCHTQWLMSQCTL